MLLFDHTTRKVRISKFGQFLLPYARRITELHDQYVAALQSSFETEHETLTLGFIYGLAQYKITDALVNFKKSHPQSTLNEMQAGSRELKEILQQRKCELAFIRDVEDITDEFVKIRYATDTIVAALPITHPLSSQETIPLRKFADENFLLEVQDTLPYKLSIKARQLSGFEPKVVVTNVDRDYLIDLVSKGMGISLVLKQILLHFSNPEIAIVHISPSVSTQISLYYLKGIELSESARYFLMCIGFEPHGVAPKTG